MRYITKDGDMLDLICKQHYGSSDGFVEKVLDANYGLSDLGPVFTSGIIIELPEIDSLSPKENTIRLWS